jgi:hypothetical protein
MCGGCRPTAKLTTPEKFASRKLVNANAICQRSLMMKPLMLPMFAALLAMVSPLHAQDNVDPTVTDGGATAPPPGDSAGPRRFWQATLPGGHYMVALERISSISRHKYILDGAMVVDEVTVDAAGQSLARFYVVSPISTAVPGNTAAAIVERGRELLDATGQRAGSDLQNMVVKKYPETSHARTVEYRVLTEAQLTSLYASLRGAWETGRGRQFTAQ